MTRPPSILPVTLACVVPTLGALLYFVYLEDHWLAPVVYTGVKLFTVAWPALFYRLLLPPHDRDLRRATRVTREIAAWGAGTGLCVSAAAWILFVSPAGEIFAQHAEPIRSKARDLGFDSYYVLFALFLSVIHSAIEEIYWRWFVFGALRAHTSRNSRPEWTAHLLAAGAFGAHHLVILAQFFPFALALGCTVAVTLGGLTWSALYARHGSLMGAWLSHALIDLALMAIGYGLLFPQT